MTDIVEAMARAYNKSVWGGLRSDKPISKQLEALRAALAAAEASGYVLVPREPTREMREAGETAVEDNEDSTRDTEGEYSWVNYMAAAVQAWKDMIAASPKVGA